MSISMSLLHAHVVSDHSQATLETYWVHTDVLGIHVTMLSVSAHTPR